MIRWFCLLAAAFAPSAAATAAEQPPPPPKAVSAERVLAFAVQAAGRHDLANAEAAFRVLASDRHVGIRSEARFRLALLIAPDGRRAEAAMLLRQVLDDQPKAQRVRIELARLLDLMGREQDAARLLREAQAGGLPPEVARFVDRYSAALRARQPFGASIEVALAPDSNINRATSSNTLGTVIGDFTIDPDSRRQSGLGAALRGQAFVRKQLSDSVSMLAVVSGSAQVYRKHDFNDIALSASVGPELSLGQARLGADLSATRRWFGMKPLNDLFALGLRVAAPVDRRTQLRFSGQAGTLRHQLNRLQSGRQFSASLEVNRAFGAGSGGSLSVGLQRMAAHDPGYSTRAVQLGASVYRDVGFGTLIGSASVGRLEADQRLSLFPDKRRDRFASISAGVTIRRLHVGTFAPFVRVTRDWNASSIAIYDYAKTRTEFGFERAF